MPTLPETAVEATLATEKGTRSMVVVVVVAAAAAGIRRPYGDALALSGRGQVYP